MGIDLISHVDGCQFRVNRLLKTGFNLIEDTDIHQLDDILAIRSFGVVHYVLRNPDGLYLIDTGSIGAIRAMERALEIKGWSSLPIRGILLTHGHLDHVLNAAAIARKRGHGLPGRGPIAIAISVARDAVDSIGSRKDLKG